MNVFDRRDVRPVINAAGTLTRLAGGIVHPDAAAAMAEAAGFSVDMAELQAHASDRIATVTGAEAGYVTSGGLGRDHAGDGRLSHRPRSGQDGQAPPHQEHAQ